MAKVDILTPEQLKKLTTLRLDKYLEEVKDYMALEMPAEDLPKYQQLIRNILAEKKERSERAGLGVSQTSGQDAQPDAVQTSGRDTDQNAGQATGQVTEPFPAQASGPNRDQNAGKTSVQDTENGMSRASGTGTQKSTSSAPGEKSGAAESSGENTSTRDLHAQTGSVNAHSGGYTGWDDSAESYIDTSYELEETKLDKRDAGFVPLLLGIIASSALAGFAGLYIYMLQTGKAQSFEQLGAMWPQKEALIWCGLVLAGLIFNLVSVGVRSAAVPLIAMLLYAAAAAYAYFYLKLPYYYAALTVLQALFCLIAAVRKGKAA